MKSKVLEWTLILAGVVLAFIINMIMYAAFSLVIMNYVGTLSCTVIAVTTAVSLIKEKNDIPGAETK